eukprot:3951749-Prymnesium_polylepis.1
MTRSPRVVEVLLRHRADVHLCSGPGRFTALYYAAGRGNASIVSMLLAAGSDPNAQSRARGTALHGCLIDSVAGRTVRREQESDGQRDHPACVEQLLRAGTDPFAKAPVHLIELGWPWRGLAQSPREQEPVGLNLCELVQWMQWLRSNNRRSTAHGVGGGTLTWVNPVVLRNTDTLDLLLRRLEQPWSPDTHARLYGPIRRRQVYEALRLGYQLATSAPFAARSHELLDCWVAFVLPAVVAAEDRAAMEHADASDAHKGRVPAELRRGTSGEYGL